MAALESGGDAGGHRNPLAGATAAVCSLQTPLARDAGVAVLDGPRDYAKVRHELTAAGYHGERIVALDTGDISAILQFHTAGNSALPGNGVEWLGWLAYVPAPRGVATKSSPEVPQLPCSLLRGPAAAWLRLAVYSVLSRRAASSCGPRTAHGN
jgi:hypothetical protein